MQKKLLSVPLLLLMSCTAAAPKKKAENLYLIKYGEAGSGGYVNQAGDTIVPAGKYEFCFTDTIRRLGMVSEKGTGKILAINPDAEVLFEVFNFDNGPDYPQEGLFRIIKDGRFGYADTAGNVVIEPRFACAFPFENGRARVADDCTTIPEIEHSSWASANWYYVDREGKIRKDP